MGTQVKKAVMSRNSFRPQISERAPMRGAERKLRKPLTPMMMPLYSRECSWNVVLRILIMGAVMRPHAKNWRNTATTACQTEACLNLHPDILHYVVAMLTHTLTRNITISQLVEYSCYVNTKVLSMVRHTRRAWRH